MLGLFDVILVTFKPLSVALDFPFSWIADPVVCKASVIVTAIHNAHWRKERC